MVVPMESSSSYQQPGYFLGNRLVTLYQKIFVIIIIHPQMVCPPHALIIFGRISTDRGNFACSGMWNNLAHWPVHSLVMVIIVLSQVREAVTSS